MEDEGDTRVTTSALILSSALIAFSRVEIFVSAADDGLLLFTVLGTGSGGGVGTRAGGGEGTDIGKETGGVETTEVIESADLDPATDE